MSTNQPQYKEEHRTMSEDEILHVMTMLLGKLCEEYNGARDPKVIFKYALGLKDYSQGFYHRVLEKELNTPDEFSQQASD